MDPLLFAVFIQNNPSWIWIIVLVICIGIEAATFTLTTIWFAVSAFFMVFLSFLPLSLIWQVLIFLIISLVLLIFTRPIMLKKINIFRQTRTNVDLLIGQKAPLITAVTSFGKGEIKINGTIWNAAGIDGQEIVAGTVCRVCVVQGNTVLVEAVQ
ncbi:MAG: NfeD family protein [Treponema sp.]|nr:NfeD family protein [Treponema sp.]